MKYLLFKTWTSKTTLNLKKKRRKLIYLTYTENTVKIKKWVKKDYKKILKSSKRINNLKNKQKRKVICFKVSEIGKLKLLNKKRNKKKKLKYKNKL